jgi:hypothetical protein
MTVDKFSRAQAASEAASRAQFAAKESAVVAIRKMLQALALALDGSSLLGQPNLGRGKIWYSGVRAMSRDAAESLPRAGSGEDGREVLCLSIKGNLEYVCWGKDRTLKVRPAIESDYRAEWPEDIAEAILVAIDYHLVGADASVARYAELKALSELLTAALSEEL